jgi:hypothetical protein
MPGPKEIIARIQEHQTELEEFDVTSLRLFGSVARGEATATSDIDLLVAFRKPPSFSRYMQLRIFLEDLLNAKVDLITESGLRDRVRPYVERDAIRVA